MSQCSHPPSARPTSSQSLLPWNQASLLGLSLDAKATSRTSAPRFCRQQPAPYRPASRTLLLSKSLHLPGVENDQSSQSLCLFYQAAKSALAMIATCQPAPQLLTWSGAQLPVVTALKTTIPQSIFGPARGPVLVRFGCRIGVQFRKALATNHILRERTHLYGKK